MRYSSIVETVIVGAGPIGLEMGVALKKQGREFAIIDEHQVGHTISWYAPGTHFFSSPERISIAGVPLITGDQGKATREEYLDYLMAVAWQFDLPIHTGLRLVGIQAVSDADHLASSGSASAPVVSSEPAPPTKDAGFSGIGWRLSLQRTFAAALDSQPIREEIRCKFLILALGDMHAPRLLGIPGENQRNVSHYLKELRNYFRQKVVIVGGRNSAVEAAIRIYRMGGEVTLLYRGESLDATSIKYWLYPEIASLIKNGVIRFLNRSEPVSIEGNHLRYRHLDPDSRSEKELISHPPSQGNELSNDPASGPERGDGPAVLHGEGVLEADQFLLLTGYVPDSSLYNELGIQLEGAAQKPVLDQETMETNLKNVFIAGTATAGAQQRHTVFIENSHEHVQKIKKSLERRSMADTSRDDSIKEKSSLKDLYEEHPES
ncbi:MAG: hypothetical protein CMF59_09580 [Leptospiraceae bacterium]|nr:hypothetical protein [Leptospiraceae bacterium]